MNMRDPYAVLGISPTATDEEVKSAYRKLARKYHPDNYASDPAAAKQAEEKMKEINAAYDRVNELRSQHTGASSGGYSGGYTGANPTYADIRMRINAGDYATAELLLERIDPSARHAEWHYLKSVLLMRRGWVNDAMAEIETACSMDPHNEEYRRAREAFARNAAVFGQGYSSRGYSRRSTGSCDTCDLCTGLMMADCCCECMGGDLIRCC